MKCSLYNLHRDDDLSLFCHVPYLTVNFNRYYSENLLNFNTFQELKSLHLRNTAFLQDSIPKREMIEELDFQHMDNIVTLGEFPKSKRVYLEGLESLQDISGLNNVEDLTIFDCDLLSFPMDVSFYRNLKKLHIDPIEPIYDVSMFGHIYDLLIKGFKGTDLSPLENVSILTLEFASNITDLCPLKNVTSLTIVGCSKITSIVNLKKLQFLEIAICEPITEISGLTSLRKLKVPRPFLASMCLNVEKGLETCTSLRTIYIDRVKNINYFLNVLSQLPNIRRMEIKEGTNLPLDRIPHLYLSIGHNSFIQSYDLQENLRSVKFLYNDFVISLNIHVKYLVYVYIVECKSLQTIQFTADTFEGGFIEEMFIDNCVELRSIVIQSNGGKVFIRNCQVLERVETYFPVEIVNCPAIN